MHTTIADVPIDHRHNSSYDPTSGLVIQVFGFSFWIIVVLCFCYNACTGRWVPSHHRLYGGGNNGDGDGDGGGARKQRQKGPTLGQQVARMTPHKRKAYFRNLFDKKGNQLTLTADHIVLAGESVSGNSSNNNNNNNSTATYDCELARDPNRDDTDNDSEHGSYSIRVALDHITNQSSAGADADADAETGIETGDPSQNKTRVIVSSGDCVICFDDFREGDVVVYSSAPSCAENAESSSSEQASTERKTEAATVTAAETATSASIATSIATSISIETAVETATSTSTSTAAETATATSSTATTAATSSTATTTAATTELPAIQSATAVPSSDVTTNATETVTTATTDAPCPHIFHKQCMVDYLATRKISANGLREGHGDRLACPICRQTFCELLPIRSVLDATATATVSNDASNDGTATASPGSEDTNRNTNRNTNREDDVVRSTTADEYEDNTVVAVTVPTRSIDHETRPDLGIGIGNGINNDSPRVLGCWIRDIESQAMP